MTTLATLAELKASDIIHGTWGHRFGPDRPLTDLRLVLNKAGNIKAMQLKRENSWIPATAAQIAEVEHYMLHLDEGLDTPDGWGLQSSVDLPDWAL